MRLSGFIALHLCDRVRHSIAFLLALGFVISFFAPVEPESAFLINLSAGFVIALVTVFVIDFLIAYRERIQNENLRKIALTRELTNNLVQLVAPGRSRDEPTIYVALESEIRKELGEYLKTGEPLGQILSLTADTWQKTEDFYFQVLRSSLGFSAEMINRFKCVHYEGESSKRQEILDRIWECISLIQNQLCDRLERTVERTVPQEGGIVRCPGYLAYSLCLLDNQIRDLINYQISALQWLGGATKEPVIPIASPRMVLTEETNVMAHEPGERLLILDAIRNGRIDIREPFQPF